jgi:Uri superfamily endonuclease
MTKTNFKLLVGDNPFHGISHLSQERARARLISQSQDDIDWATRLVSLSLENGADGFMFSVDQTTLQIIQKLGNNKPDNVSLYAIAPYAYEYVRKSTQAGGVSGLAKGLAKEMIFSSNIKVLMSNVLGLLRFNLPNLMKTYVAYELSRIKSVTRSGMHLDSFMLHEIITDMALALNMEKLFKSYITYLESCNIRPGLETRNFPYLVNKFKKWHIDFSKLTITASFNKAGFQMCPSQTECEEALERASDAEVIAMSVLAAGYLKPIEAASYLKGLKGLSGIVIGVSKEQLAKQTFRAFGMDDLLFLPAIGEEVRA